MRAAPPIAERRPGAVTAAPRSSACCARSSGAQSIAYLRVQQGRRPGGVAPCVLTTSAASSSTSTARSSTAPARRSTSSPARARCSSGSRASGRPFAFFTNGSHMAPAAFARELRGVGLPVEDEQVLTPLCSVQAYLERFGRDARVLPFVDRAPRARTSRRPACTSSTAATARASTRSSSRTPTRPTSTSSSAPPAPSSPARACSPAATCPAYAGANGPILSRGAMITAAIAKASGAPPDRRRQAVAGGRARAGAAARRAAPRRSRSSATTFASTSRSAASAARRRSSSAAGSAPSLDLARLPEKRRPHRSIETVAELLEWL